MKGLGDRLALACGRLVLGHGRQVQVCGRQGQGHGRQALACGRQVWVHRQVQVYGRQV